MRRKRRVKRTSRIPAPSAARALRGRFRPALAADGSMLLLDAVRGNFELNRVETRVVVEFVRLLDKGAIGA